MSNIGYVVSSMGADIEEETRFREELHGIVNEMVIAIPNETKILEGTLHPEYELVRASLENELSQPKLTEQQWKTALQNGSWTTDPTLVSTHDSSTLSSSVEPSNPSCRTIPLRRQSTSAPILLCQAMSEGCGCETDVTRESCDCMEQTINVPMDGMPNEGK